MKPKSSRKRQTRLQFAAASSSPVASRDRASRITYDGSPSKKRRVDGGKAVVVSDDEDTINVADAIKSLPTPVKSSFTSAATGSKNARNNMSPVRPRRSTHRKGMFGGRAEEAMIELSSDSETSDTLPDAAIPPAKEQRKTRSKGKSRVVEESEDESYTAPQTRHSAKKQLVLFTSDEETPSKDSVGLPKNSAVGAESESESSDQMPTSSPLKKPRKPSARNTRRRSDSFEVPDDVVELEDDDEDDSIQPTPRRRVRRLPTPEEDDKEQEDTEEDVQTPQRKRLERSSNRKQARRVQEDLEEDLEFLKSSPPSERKRSKAVSKKTEKQSALELLKRRRAGTKADPPSSQPSKPDRIVLPDTTSEEDEENEVASDNDGIEDDYESDVIDDEPEPAPRGYRRADVLDMFQEDENDEGFVVEDDNADEPIGAPDIPIEFTALARAKARDLFKYAIEWMVQKKINPAFASDDEVYRLAFQKLNDEVKGLAGSKFTSSAWTPNFTRALKARPDMGLEEIDAGTRAVMAPHCMACNRTSHPATWSIQFTGKPYHQDSLEPLSDDEDSEDEEGGNSHSQAYNSEGQSIPDDSMIFTVGKYCMHNAQMSHTLTHWRYHLNSWVVDYLVRTGHCSAQKIVERDNWSVKKKQKYANKVVDDMESTGEIRRLYKDYKAQIDAAVEEKEQNWGRRR